MPKIEKAAFPVALVTGGSRGIGEAVVRTFAEAGYAVAINCSSEKSLEAAENLAAEVAKVHGVEAKAVCADVSSFQEVAAMVAEVQAMWGRIDVLVNNAGITRDGLLARMSEEAFDRVASEIARRAPEVAKEFRMTRYEMLVVNRTVALKRLEARSGVREMKILANSLLQSIQYGTPLTEALQSIAAEARAGQLSELEQKAGRISAVIGVPLIVLVLFPVIALIIAPAAIELARAF